MIPLKVRDETYAGFVVPRLRADVHFEPSTSAPAPSVTLVANALVDIGAPYVVIPPAAINPDDLRIYRDLGMKPYRVGTAGGRVEPQRFAEVGVRFLITVPGQDPAYWPSERFLKVQAYLLDPQASPNKDVLIGLQSLLDNFVTTISRSKSFLAPA